MKGDGSWVDGGFRPIGRYHIKLFCKLSGFCWICLLIMCVCCMLIKHFRCFRLVQIVGIHMFYSFILQLIVNGHNIVIGPNVQKHAEKVNEHLTEQ